MGLGRVVATGVFGGSCVVCGGPGRDLCTTCRATVLAAPRPAGGHAVFVFDGPVRAAVLALKYRNRRALGAELADLAVLRLGRDGSAAGIGLVTWAPTGRARSRRRGFDQAEVLARAIARRLGVPCRRLLSRPGGAAGDLPQTGRSRDDRLTGPVMRARPGVTRADAPCGVLVVDDVVTTGATLAAAERALRAAGHLDVRPFAFAATPERWASRSSASSRSSAATAVGSATR